MPPQPSGNQRIVEIKQIGIVLIDQVARAVVEILDIGDIGQRVERMLHAVQALRIEALPPLLLALSAGQIPVVGNARQRPGMCPRRARAGTTTSCAPDAR